jgi:hypothetical protein
MISYNLMFNKSYLIFILNNYRYDNYLNSNRYNKLNVSEGHICNFLHNSDTSNVLTYKNTRAF